MAHAKTVSNSLMLIGILFALACFITAFTVIHFKHTQEKQTQFSLLIITIISGISCLSVCIFKINMEWDLAQIIIFQIIYLCQSVYPFLIIGELFQNIRKVSYFSFITFILYNTISILVIVCWDKMLSHFFWLLSANLVLEAYFVITGLVAYWGCRYEELSLPIVPYILVRPIIVEYFLFLYFILLHNY